MGSLVLSIFSLFVFCVVVSKSVADPGPKWHDENTATESRMPPVEGFLNNWTAKPRHDAEIAHELSDPPQVYPGDNLFRVSIEVKLVGANLKEFEGMDKRISRSLKRLLMEKLSTFSTFKELFPLTVKRTNAPGLLFAYWLYFSPGQENVYIPFENRVKQLMSEPVSNLRYGKAVVVLTSVEDVDECVSGLSMCDPEANCLNTFGFYFCQCAKGFNDPSSIASGVSCIRNVKSETERLSSQFVSALKNCHMTIEGDSGKCLSPVYPCMFEYKWCNWTVAASHWKGVAVQIHGFSSPEDCNQNRDEIFICISQQIVRQVAQACLNKTENVVTSVLAVYATFEQGSSNQAEKCFQVEQHMSNEIKTSSPSLYGVLMLSNFGISQEVSAAPDNEADEKSHMIQPSNLLSGEAAELVFQNCKGRWSDAHFQVFAQPMAEKHRVWKSTEQSDYFLVSSHGVQVSAQQHASNLEYVHLWNSLCAHLLSRTSKMLPSTHFDFSSLLRPSLSHVGFPGSTPSEEVQCRGNSVQLDASEGISMGLMKSFDPADRWMAVESNLVSGDWVSSSWDVFENLESGHSGCKNTLPVQTLQTYKYMQTETDHQEPWEPQSSVEILNAGMRESEMVYSVSLGQMVLSSLTTSFHDSVWMKTRSQNLFAVEGGLQTLYQTDESVPLVAPGQVYTSLETNSRVVTENESRNSEVKWLKAQMFSSRTFIEPVQQDTEAIEKEVVGISGAQHTINPSISHPPVWMTLVPKLQDEGVENTAHLFEVSARVDLAKVVYRNLHHLEKRLLQSVQNLIMDNLMSFYPPLQKILPKGTKRISPSGFHFVYELHFCPNGENVQHNLQTHLNSLSNKLVANMQNGQVYLVSITVKDSGLRSSFGIKEILTASAVGAFLLVSLALALCFVIFKRSHKNHFKPHNPYAANISGRNSSSEELGSEESLLIMRRGSVNYISFRKFQPIPEEMSDQETDSDMISSPAKKTWPVVKMFP